MHVSSNRTSTGAGQVTAAGEIDLATAPHLDRAVRELLSCDEITSIEIDMAGVTFCDSSCLAVLDEALDLANRRGVRLRVTDLQSPVRRVLEIVGLLDVLTRP
ncbi:STAS domain-containing protein [Actinoplanes couchii]|uniref:Anti-sigma factor antagonist n=1 Tax=Actinoplanes couchii TaxID=403638 RepID=A0ABQ3XRM0_9ACTN|nr:STAS domain-containing protein [Actinoplanes couchii]MDR6318895.1 anti-sigma B factor antagonist [Actinoplanes couchii]GID61166.1 anti-sigma factor antagonist [Actinoplanes couchii]